MKIELDKKDAAVIVSSGLELLTIWKYKTKAMQDDKTCPLENYNEHLDDCKKLGIIIEKIKEQL